MDKEQLEGFLKTARDRLGFWTEQGPNIHYWQARVKEIETELADLAEKEKEPEPRHGDYGYGDHGKITGRLYSRIALRGWDNELTSAGQSCMSGGRENGRAPKIILGNIFDDLEALREPLEKCEVKLRTRGEGYDIKFAFDEKAIVLKIEDTYCKVLARGTVRIELKDELPALILNLRRIHATMLRKQNAEKS